MTDLVIYTIGFTKKSAAEFFNLLRTTGAKHLLDVRLNNTSQLAGFTKRDDLRYFLSKIVNIQYHEMSEFAPSELMLKEYRKNKDWGKYENSYKELIHLRRPESQFCAHLIEEGVILLCSEPKADRCHRRLAAEYIAESISPTVKIIHL